MSDDYTDRDILENTEVEVRSLARTDLDWMVRIDRERSGRARSEYLRVKLHESETDTGIRISLAAWVRGEPVGFLMGRLYYGEFGLPEPVAILDTVAVSEAHAGRGVGKALLRQLCTNLGGLGIEKVRTEVEWDQLDLIRFFQRTGFRPAPRLSLELPVARVRS